MIPIRAGRRAQASMPATGANLLLILSVLATVANAGQADQPPPPRPPPPPNLPRPSGTSETTRVLILSVGIPGGLGVLAVIVASAICLMRRRKTPSPNLHRPNSLVVPGSGESEQGCELSNPDDAEGGRWSDLSPIRAPPHPRDRQTAGRWSDWSPQRRNTNASPNDKFRRQSDAMRQSANERSLSIFSRIRPSSLKMLDSNKVAESFDTQPVKETGKI